MVVWRLVSLVGHLAGRISLLFPGVRRDRAGALAAERWAREATEEQLFAALADAPDFHRKFAVELREFAAVELCARDPGRPVEPIVTAFRNRLGREAQPYQLPNAEELVELRLHMCECEALRNVEIFLDVLADPTQDRGLRTHAVTALAFQSDHRAAEAVRGALNDADGLVQLTAREAIWALNAHRPV